MKTLIGRVSGLVLGIAIVTVFGGVFLAANMAFSLNYPLFLTGTATGHNTISLPWVRVAGVDDAFQLIDHINEFGSPAGAAQRLEKWLPCSNATYIYSGAPGDPPGGEILLEPGVGYFVKVGADVNYPITGSHDPELEVTFRGANCGGSGMNLYAPPYHGVASDGRDLIDDINANGVPPDSVERLQFFVPATNANLLYAGATTDPPAPQLSPGEAVFVKVGRADVSYRPTHY